MSLGDVLRRKLTAQKWSENPLQVIGLSTEILRLGLSDDDFYHLARRQARDVFAKFHPDRSGVDSEIGRRFGEAFDLIKDRDTFDVALVEFRSLSKSQRSDLFQAQKLARASGEEVASLKHLVSELEESARILNLKLRLGHRFMSVPALKFPVEDTPLACAQERISSHFIHSIAQVREIYVVSMLVGGLGTGEKRGYNTSTTHNTCEELANKKTRQAYPLARWSNVGATGFKCLAYGRKDPRKPHLVSLPHAPRSLPRLYRQGLRELARLLEGVELSEFGLAVNHFSVQEMMIEESNEVIIGSITVNSLIENRAKWEMVNGSLSLPPAIAFDEIMPFLHQGSLLVTRAPCHMSTRSDRRTHSVITEKLLEKAPIKVRHLLLFAR
ncbi:MAG TPA: hypothetical protein VJJ22_03840 [Candidatus Paceibacterota bacterium]